MINVLWHFDALARDKPISYVNDFLLTARGATTPLGREVVGVPQELTIAVYKLSFLTYHDTSLSPWDTELLAVLKLLQNWRLADHALAPSSSGLLLVGKIYHIACMCYVSYLLSGTEMSSCGDVSSFVREAALLLRLSRIGKRPFNCLSWPLIILSIFCTDIDDYETLMECLDAFVSTSKMAGYGPAVQLVKKVWESKIGPDILRRPETLQSIAI